MNELTNYVPHLSSQESGFLYEPIYDNVHENPLGRAPKSSVQTMVQDDPIAHRLTSASQASTSDICKADLAELKDDLARHNEDKLLD